MPQNYYFCTQIRKTMDLSIVVPLLNESESLPELEVWIRRVVEKENLSYEIVFVDDGSTDASWSIIQRLAAENPHVKALRFRRNYGKSPALNEGLYKLNFFVTQIIFFV